MKPAMKKDEPWLRVSSWGAPLHLLPQLPWFSETDHINDERTKDYHRSYLGGCTFLLRLLFSLFFSVLICLGRLLQKMFSQNMAKTASAPQTLALGALGFLGFSSPSSAFFLPLAFFGFSSSSSSSGSPSAFLAVSGMSSSATWPSSQALSTLAWSSGFISS